jgi:hypothetical protein
MRMTRTFRIGLILIATGLIPLGCWMSWFYTRTWIPVDVPLSLSRGTHYSSGEFSVNLTRRYALEIINEAKNNPGSIPTEALPCPLGTQRSAQFECPIAPELKTHWVLSSEDGMVQGDSDEQVKVERYVLASTLGYFRCHRGRRYKLEVDVLSDSSSLNPTNPHLFVEVADDSRMIGGLFTALLSIVCGLIAATGGTMLVVWFIRERRAA